MTTRLRQSRVKSGTPEYQTLEEQLKAMSLGGGVGYSVPEGGIPLFHLSEEVRGILESVSKSLMIPNGGVSIEHLSEDMKRIADKALSSYTLPAGGIPISDMDKELSDVIGTAKMMYRKPEIGIPLLDLEEVLQKQIKSIETYYKLPENGIPTSDLEDRDLLLSIDDKYQKPVDGIPDEDLKESYATKKDYEEFVAHKNDESSHIKSHLDLEDTGLLSHNEIDLSIESLSREVKEMTSELTEARDGHTSLYNRISAALGMNTFIKVEKKEDWEKGALTNLRVNHDNSIEFIYNAEPIDISLHDISNSSEMNDNNKIGELIFETESGIYLGQKPWQLATGRSENVGVRIETNIYIEKSGVYEFSSQFSGRMKLSIGQNLLYDTQAVFSQVDAYTRSASINLVGGRLYKFVFEGWHEDINERMVVLRWKKPDSTHFSEIPRNVFNNSGYVSNTGMYVSQVFDTKDTNISKWLFELDAEDARTSDDVKIELRSSDDNIQWLDWKMVTHKGEILERPGRYVQVQITVNKLFDFYTPVVKGFRIRLVSAAFDLLIRELIEARGDFVTLEGRLKSLQEQLITLTKTHEIQDLYGIHPDLFISNRLTDYEINLLTLMLIEVGRGNGFMRTKNSESNLFSSHDSIDKERSDDYEIVGGKIRATKSTIRLEGDNEWEKWEKRDIISYKGNLRLDYDVNAPLSQTIEFANWNLWSTRDSARISSQYQGYIAQPFFTGEDVNLLTRLQVRVYDYTSSIPCVFSICESIKGKDVPNVESPLWSAERNGTDVINFTGIRIPVVEKTKYWIVIRHKEPLEGDTRYTRFYLSSNSTSVNGRLKGSNPESANLFFKYTADVKGEKGWLTDTGYFLTFNISEARAVKPYGEAERIIDVEKESVFEGINMVHTGNKELISLIYYGSNDGELWSEGVDDIKRLPHSRFVKIRMSLSKTNTSTGTPTVSKIDIFKTLSNSYLVTNVFEIDKIPSHAICIGESDASVKFDISRDDGHTWRRINTYESMSLEGIASGQSVRFRLVFDGEHPLDGCSSYAFGVLTYRDISQQNITALFEEYVAEEGQRIFRLKDRYTTGNHSLQVFLNGIRQSIYKDYQEIDERTISFGEPLIGGIDADRVTFVVAAGAYDMHDAQLKNEMREMRDVTDSMHESHSKTLEYNEENLVSKITYSADSYIKSVEYFYDDNLLSRAIKKTRTYIETTDYEYNESGLVIKEIVNVERVME